MDPKLWDVCEHMLGDEATVPKINQLASEAQSFIEDCIERMRAEDEKTVSR